MTTKSAFTAEEWNALLQGPMNAAMFIAVADPGGIIGPIKEMYSAAKEIAKAAQKPAANELMGALLAEFKDRESMKQARPEFSSKTDIELLKSEIRAELQQTAQTVDEKATTEEATEYKEWLYQIGNQTAKAAKEGSFLGFGGVRVSEAETAALKELANLLGVSVSGMEAPA